MKTCSYHFERGYYKTECGAVLIFRPTLRCDKCGRKPQEVRYAVDQRVQPKLDQQEHQDAD